MDFEQQCRDVESCRGVIKKLFPSKRYGFAVCECDKHTGEAHFNYSDLDLPDSERSCLVVGWRIEFNVIEQHKKTDHCDYRAIQVKPVDVMVVQCDVSEVWENGIAVLTCRELTGKIIYVTKNKYNGKFESEAVTRRDTCRAAVTWEQMKQKNTFALHCSQDTVSPTTSSPYRPKFKTPEKRSRRADGQSYSDSLLPMSTNNAASVSEETFGSTVCEHSNRSLAQGHNDSGLVSPEDQHSSTASKTFVGPVVRVLRTSTPKTERPAQVYEPRFIKTSPQMATSIGVGRTSSSGSVCSAGNIASTLSYSSKFRGSFNNVSGEVRDRNSMRSISDSVCRGSDDSMMRSLSTGSASPKDCRSGASRRNLDREFDMFCVTPQESTKAHQSPPRNSAYMDKTRMMSFLKLKEQIGFEDTRSVASTSEQAGYSGRDSVFGLYDANCPQDKFDIYSVRNSSRSPPSWESPAENLAASHPIDQLPFDGGSQQRAHELSKSPFFKLPSRENDFNEAGSGVNSGE